MERKNDWTLLAILDGTQSWIAKRMEDDTAVTILGLLSDDPTNWEEAQSAWPRVRTKVVCERPEQLPLEPFPQENLVELLSAANAWVVVDFNSKRVLNGGEFQPFERNTTLAMQTDAQGKQHGFLSIHLPPWWELHNSAQTTEVLNPRQTPIVKSNVDREFLFGAPFLNEIASKIISTVSSASWENKKAAHLSQVRYRFTVELHRDWLMTPRAELDGRKPRDLLHGAQHWSSLVVQSQKHRCTDGDPLVALPTNWIGYATAPMGFEEICMYFDFCREAIEAGWDWCDSKEGRYVIQKNKDVIPRLTRFLKRNMDKWLDSSLDDGAPPSFIIECERRHVPRGGGVRIEGIDRVQPDYHVIDCNCPLCTMMIDGTFGIYFDNIDGYHLELDDEFAFSMSETLEEWEQDRFRHGGFIVEDDDEEHHAKSSADELTRIKLFSPHTFDEDSDSTEDLCFDPFGSSWMGINTEPVPGDQTGMLKMAFMLSEIIGLLMCHEEADQDITKLNMAFDDFRTSDPSNPSHRQQRSDNLKKHLDEIADRFPVLGSKSSELQSYIDETNRLIIAELHKQLDDSSGAAQTTR